MDIGFTGLIYCATATAFLLGQSIDQGRPGLNPRGEQLGKEQRNLNKGKGPRILDFL